MSTMSTLLLLALTVMSVVADDTSPQPQTTTTTEVTAPKHHANSHAPEDSQKLHTEESRVLRKPENASLPQNHSETLRAMPTQQAKSAHSNHVQTQTTQSERVVKVSPESVLSISAATDVGRFKDFRPSPHLETIYEYNRFPVEPAHPEAKYFQTSIKVPIHSTLSHAQDDNAEEEEAKDAWTSKVRFPHTHPLTVNNHPYPYLKDAFDKGVAVGVAAGKRPITHKHFYGSDGWDKTLQKRPPSKTYLEDGGYQSVSDLSSSPWKKIIKILTAFIPIGLLLSALTPSIITIGPMNATAVRARSGEKSTSTLLPQLALDGCDERIFCELMLSAEESGKSEKSIEAMLENYVQSHGNATRLQLIYKAIKGGNCSSLRCNSIKD